MQEIPVGELETVPEPATVTDSGWELATAVNVAVADLACDIVTEQVLAAPVQAPTQPEKMYPPCAVAVRVTEVPLLNAVMHVPLVQERPTGELVTVPDPVTVTDSGYETATAVNVAVTVLAADIVTEQVGAVPEQAPPQLEKA